MSRTLRKALREALTVDKFQAWLRSKRLDYQVGQARNTGCCPIANYLVAQTGRRELQVTQSCVWDACNTYLHRDDLDWPMPVWTSDFITAVDQFEPDEVITPGTALALLGC